MTIGDSVVIGENAVVCAASIGSFVVIGKNTVIVSWHATRPLLFLNACSLSLQGRGCILKDCTRVEDGAVLPPDMVVPPFSLVAGNPGISLSLFFFLVVVLDNEA